jgi:flagellar protein FliO/FliZ
MILIFFLVFPSMGVLATDFGEGDRNVNQILDSFENDSIEVESDDSLDENPDDPINEEEADELEIGGAQNQNIFYLIFQMVLALGAVILFIYFLLKFINKRAQNFNNHSTVQNIGGAGVGSNRSVQIVRVGKRILVVGVGDTVQLLKEIEDPKEIDEMLESYQREDFFEQPISKFTGWLQKRKSDKTNDSNEVAFRTLLNKEMKDVKKSQNKIHSALGEKDE